MSRAVFKKLSGDLRCEWFEELADDAPGGSLPLALSAPLPSRIRGASGRLFQNAGGAQHLQMDARGDGCSPRRMSHLSHNKPHPEHDKPDHTDIPSTSSAQTSESKQLLSCEVSHSGKIIPIASPFDEPSGSMSSGEAWEGVPNAPGSGLGARAGPATASALHHPAISRVLKVSYGYVSCTVS